MGVMQIWSRARKMVGVGVVILGREFLILLAVAVGVGSVLPRLGHALTGKLALILSVDIFLVFLAFSGRFSIGTSHL
jgi:hypothetical protein